MTTPQQMQSQVFDSMKQSQQVASQLANTMTETWAGATRPTHRGGPHGDVLPGPAEFVDQMFDFWLQLLEAQRSFVLSGVNALVPSVPTPGRVARPTPSKARSIMDGTTSGPVVSPAPSSRTAARTAGSTANEHISGAAADAIATAAAISVEKTATIKKTPAEKTPAPETTSAAETTSTAKKTSTVKTPKTSTANETSAPKMTSKSKKASTPKTTSAAKKTSTAKKKRS